MICCGNKFAAADGDWEALWEIAKGLLAERDALAEKFATAVDDFTAEALEHTAALQRAAKAERERDALAAEVERLRNWKCPLAHAEVST